MLSQSSASKNPVDLDEIYQNDCFVEAVVFVRGHATIIGGVAVAIASIMVSNKHRKVVISRPGYYRKKTTFPQKFTVNNHKFSVCDLTVVTVPAAIIL